MNNQLQQAYKDLIELLSNRWQYEPEQFYISKIGYVPNGLSEEKELRAKIAELEAKEDDSHMLFHECPNCNCRCNCPDTPCSCDCCDEELEATPIEEIFKGSKPLGGEEMEVLNKTFSRLRSSTPNLLTKAPVSSAL